MSAGSAVLLVRSIGSVTDSLGKLGRVVASCEMNFDVKVFGSFESVSEPLVKFKALY